MDAHDANIAVILASGTGERFGAHVPKQFFKLAGKTVLEHTLDTFEHHEGIDEVIIVGSQDNLHFTEEVVSAAGYRKVTKIIAGGATRQQSSMAGISAISGDGHKVLVHDAVRPLLDHATIDRCLEALDHADAVDTAIAASDTVIRVDDDDHIAAIPDRSTLRLGQTPQGFRSGLLRRAHQRAANDQALTVTDDCGLIVHYGLSTVAVVTGGVNNIKITYASDIYLADRIFQLRSVKGQDDALEPSALRGKHFVVFGASRGIGQSIAQLAQDVGANIVAVSRADNVDVIDEAAVRSVLADAKQQHGAIDAVILTAGVLRTGLLVGQSYAAIDEQIAVNLRGCITVAREAFDAMKDNGGSICLFTSSSYTRGRARSAVYSATKAAVVNLMQGLSEEYRPFRVRINAINPERTATPMRTENFGNEPPEKLLDADTVARASIATCLSDITGQVVDVRRKTAPE